MNYKEELLTTVIPAIEKMLDKERKHLVFLFESKKKLDSIGYFYFKDIDIEMMIDTSRDMVIHLQKRLNEYIEYANKIE